MKPNDKRRVQQIMVEVRRIVREEIAGNSVGKYGRGLAAEGFAGGYLRALDDIDGMLTSGHASDHRGYWREAIRRMNERSAIDI